MADFLYRNTLSLLHSDSRIAGIKGTQVLKVDIL